MISSSNNSQPIETIETINTTNIIKVILQKMDNYKFRKCPNIYVRGFIVSIVSRPL